MMIILLVNLVFDATEGNAFVNIKSAPLRRLVKNFKQSIYQRNYSNAVSNYLVTRLFQIIFLKVMIMLQKREDTNSEYYETFHTIGSLINPLVINCFAI